MKPVCDLAMFQGIRDVDEALRSVGAQTLGEQLEAERVKSDGLDEQVTRLQIEFEELSRRAEQSKDREKELVEHNKEQVGIPLHLIAELRLIQRAHRSENYRFCLLLPQILVKKLMTSNAAYESSRNKSRVMTALNALNPL